MSASSRARIVAREKVAARVDVMLRLLDERDPELRQRLFNGPLAELSAWDDIEIKYIQAGQQSTDCTIAGAYIDAEPPIIGIVNGTFSKRESFTVLHELGHHLQQTEAELIEALPDQPDRGRVLEEMTSDAFAAAILIPPELAKKTLGDGTPSARQVASLWIESNASRAAVCVRAVQNLTSPGHVVLLDRDGLIVFTASYLELPLRRGTDQSQTAIVRAARNSNMKVVSGKTAWQYVGGELTDELYAQATCLGEFLLVVSVIDGAPWEKISLSSPARTFTPKWHECSHCGHVMIRSGAELCPNCHDPKCEAEDCRRCSCPSRVAEKTCHECFMVKPAQFFTHSPTVCDDHF